MFKNIKTKKCVDCSITKLITEFYNHSHRSDGVSWVCKACTKVRTKAWRVNNLERSKKQCMDYYRKHREYFRQLNSLANTKRRELIFEHYGAKCALCGYSNKDALSVDHIFGGGNKHRREIGNSSISLYNWIIKNNYPKDFRVLCMNCQYIELRRLKREGGKKICLKISKSS